MIRFKIYLKEGSVNKVDPKLIKVEQQIQAIRKRMADRIIAIMDQMLKEKDYKFYLHKWIELRKHYDDFNNAIYIKAFEQQLYDRQLSWDVLTFRDSPAYEGEDEELLCQEYLMQLIFKYEFNKVIKVLDFECRQPRWKPNLELLKNML